MISFPTPTPEDYRALAMGEAYLPAPWEALVEVVGRDRVSFLDSQLTQRLTDLGPGDVRPCAMADRKGHAIADLWLRASGSHLELRLPVDRWAAVAAVLERHHFSEDVEWRRVATGVPFLVLGASRRLHEFPLAASAIVPVREVSPSDAVIFPAPGEEESWRAALRQMGLRPVSVEAFHLRRLEVGVGWFGSEVDEERLVPEPGWTDRVSYTKGCYLGQETLARLHYRGQLNWKLCRLEGESAPDPVGPGGGRVELSDRRGESVGWLVTRVGHPAGGWRGLGYLHRGFRDAGPPGELVVSGEPGAAWWTGEVTPPAAESEAVERA